MTRVARRSQLPVVGIDLGGTHIRAAVVDARGEVLASRVETTAHTRCREDFVELVASLTRDWAIHAVGVGATGPIDRHAGMINNPDTLPAHLNGDVIRPLEHRLGVPAVLLNDAAAAVLGEAWRGHGREANRVAMVTVGTGIGVAWTHGRDPVSAIDGEAGHHSIDPNGPRCYCGNRGCWESLCSGTAIATLARARLAASPEARTALRDAEPLTSQAVATAAQAGDAIASSIVEEVGRNFGRGLGNLIRFLVPDVVILGGRVMRAYDLFEPYVTAVVSEAVTGMDRTTEILPSALGDRAGVLGAAWTALCLTDGDDQA